MDETEQPSPVKKCPRCGQEIRAEAVICRFCFARFKVEERGYCAKDHQVVSLTPAGLCPLCGGEVMDKTTQSMLVEEPQAPAPVAPPPPQPALAPHPAPSPTPYYAPPPGVYPAAHTMPGGYPPAPGYVVPPRNSGLAVASLVLGILFLWGVGSILALIFGYQALGEINRSNGRVTGRGMAIAGIVLGWVGIAGAILLIILIVAVANDLNDYPYGLARLLLP
jgi:hypothetical protein